MLFIKGIGGERKYTIIQLLTLTAELTKVLFIAKIGCNLNAVVQFC